MKTYCIFLLSSKLPRSLEVDTQEREFTFVVLANVLDSIDMEGHGEAIYGKDNRLRLPVDEDLHIQISVHRRKGGSLETYTHILNFPWQRRFALIARESFPCFAFLTS